MFVFLFFCEPFHLTAHILLHNLASITRRHDIQYNNIKPNDTQYNDAQYNDAQYNDAQYNDIEYHYKKM